MKNRVMHLIKVTSNTSIGALGSEPRLPHGSIWQHSSLPISETHSVNQRSTKINVRAREALDMPWRGCAIVSQTWKAWYSSFAGAFAHRLESSNGCAQL